MVDNLSRLLQTCNELKTFALALLHMKNKIFAIIAVSLACSQVMGATYYWTRGSATGSNNRYYTNINNWSLKDTYDKTTNPNGYNLEPASSIPGESDEMKLMYRSGSNGSDGTSTTPTIMLSQNVDLGKMIINNTDRPPLMISGPDNSITFNKKALNSDIKGSYTIITKERNIGTFSFDTNIIVAHSGNHKVIVQNTSDADLAFLGKNFTAEGEMASGEYREVRFSFSQRTKSDEWIDYASGDIILNTGIYSKMNVVFSGGGKLNAPNYSEGVFWLKGTQSNVMGWTHITDCAKIYLDKRGGAQAITSDKGKMLYVGWRSHVVWLNDNQIADDITVQFKTPIIDTQSPSDLTCIFDLNGHSERIGKIDMWNDNTLAKQGLQTIIDFGNGGEQSFTFASINFQTTNSSFQSRVNFYRTFLDFRNYRMGEDHVYCASKLSASTFMNDDPRDRTTKTYLNLLRFPEFGVFGVDYEIAETQVTINGETLYEYSPRALGN